MNFELEMLEPRVLLSADGLAALADNGGNAFQLDTLIFEKPTIEEGLFAQEQNAVTDNLFPAGESFNLFEDTPGESRNNGPDLPDLVITGATAAAQDYVHSFQVSFTLTNQGTAAVTGTVIWNRIYLAKTATFDPFNYNYNDIVGQRAVRFVAPQGGLLPGQSQQISLWFNLESYSWDEAVGSRYLHIIADDFQNVPESNETNNQYQAVPIQLSKAAIDLHPTSISVPATGPLGSPVTMSLGVENLGTNPATGNENRLFAQIYLSTDAVLSTDTDLNLGAYPIGSIAPLGAGASATGNLLFLPGDTVQKSQDYYLIAVVNSQNMQMFSQPENNVANNTIVSSSTIRFSDPTADLIITAGSAVGTSANAGDTVSVSWTVRNQGTTTAGMPPLNEWDTAWSDRIYISADNVWDANDKAVSFVNPQFPQGDPAMDIVQPLAAGAQYSITANIRLPAGGGNFLIFKTDDWDEQLESLENNNTLAIPFTTNYTPPDLQVSAAQITSGTVGLNQTIEVSWTVTNGGAGPVLVISFNDEWNDEVYLSNDAVYDTGDYSLTSSWRNRSLNAGASYTINTTIYLPGSRTGNYLLFITDKYNVQAESNETNNLRAIPISYPSSDLVVTSLEANPTVVGGGSNSFTVTYTVRNQGPTATSESYWYDRLYLSTDNQLDINTDTSLTYSYISSSNTTLPLNVNATYTKTLTVYLPSNTPTGAVFLFLWADRDGYVSETNNDNNTSMIPLTVGKGDLRVDTTSAAIKEQVSGSLEASSWYSTNPSNPFELRLGENSTVTTIQTVHKGTEPAAVTLTLKNSSGATLGSWAAVKDTQNPNIWKVANLQLALGPGAYTITDSEPGTWVTDYYTDRGMAQVNYLPVRAGSTPIQVISGESILLTWTVTNADSANALNTGGWYDTWYLSNDATYDTNDTYLAEYYYNASTNPLAGGGNYSKNATVTINATETGTKYLILFSDRYQNVLETNESNNRATAIPAQIIAADLRVVSFTAPTTLVLGEEASITWQVTNQGTGPTVGSWYDGVYLSDDDQFDANDRNLNEWSMAEFGPLAIGSSYTTSKTFTPSATLPLGQKYLIVKANSYYWQRVNESDTTNNTRAFAVTVAAPDLVPSQPSAPATISWGQIVTVSFRVTNQGIVAAAGSWGDAVVLSQNQTYESGSDTVLNTYWKSSSEVMAAGSSYSVNLTFTFSERVSGDYYLLFITDRWNDQGETNNNNNLVTAPVHINNGPDLQITGTTGPASGSPSGIIEVSWTVGNPGGPAGATWYDSVYLSGDQTYDYNDWHLRSEYNLGISLLPGQKALRLDGSYSWVQTGVNLNQTTAGAGVTMEAWVYPLSSTSSPRPVLSSNTYSSSYHWAVAQGDGTWLIYNGVQAVDTGIAVDVGKWQHLAAVFDPDTGVKLYKNGVSTPFASAQIDFTNDDAPVAIGADNGANWNNFHGLMDEVRIWNGVRTATEIESNRNNQLTGTETGLEAYWKFNDGSGRTAADATSHGYNATLRGYYAEGIPAWIAEASGGYTITRLVQLPSDVTAGNYYLIFWADRGSYQMETNDNNNQLTRPLSIESADLAVSNLTAPGTAAGGQSITVSWRVTNSGSGTANASYWADYVYLSDDAQYDSSDRYLTSYSRDNTGGLAAGAYYDASVNVSLPANAQGAKYLVVIADAYTNQGETNENNNSAAVAIMLNAPDLTVPPSGADAPTAPARAVLGDTISVSWTVQNSGAYGTTVSWEDQVYLSQDNVWSESDQLLGSFWYSAGLTPGQKVTRTGNVFLPESTIIGPGKYLLFVADGGRQHGETNETNNVAARVIEIAAPDLTVGNVTAPASAALGEVINVSWTVTSSSEAAKADWYDYIYLSRNNVLDANDQRLLTVWTGGQTPLNAGASYTETRSVTLPAGASGTHWLFFVADGSRDQGETNETNNVASAQIELVAPDLTVERVTVPGSLISAQEFQVSYRVVNSGAAPALATWSDGVYLSSDSQFNPGTDVLLQTLSAADRAPLAAAAAYSSIRTVRLPGIAAGTYYIIVVADPDQSQGESNETNNFKVSDPITVTAPDLTVTAVTAPATASPNQSIPVSWTVRNAGAVTAPGDWSDYIYVSTDAVLDGADALLVAHETAVLTPLAAGDVYTVQRLISLPNLAVGDYYLIVVGDGNQAQGEANETNNSRASQVIRIEVPDLQVTNVQAPAAVTAQQTIAVTWTVSNSGPGTASASWRDAVYLSNDNRLTGDDLWVNTYDVSDAAPLAANASYTRTFNVTIPQSASATYQFLLVVADGNARQGEADETNNYRAVAITITPPPDLQITASLAPATAAVGQWIEVAWTVTNGATSTAFADWTDRVYLSDNNQLDAGDTLLAWPAVVAQTPLAGGANYSLSVPVRLPATGVGSKFIIIKVDADNAQVESNETTNNVVTMPITITDPDLTITDSTAPTTASWGQRVTISWTVRNQGSGAAASQWYDRVYLSANDTLEAGTDTLVLENYAIASGLAPNATYTVTREIQMPAGLTGSVKFIFVTDALSQQAEANENNNVRVQAQATSFNAADLSIVAGTAPAAAAWGERIALEWTVTNSGNGEALSSWWDSVYLSTDNQLGEGDVVLTSAYRYNTAALGAGANYIVTQSAGNVISIPAAIGAGTRYLIFQADTGNSQLESNNGNNTVAVAIEIRSPNLAFTAGTTLPASLEAGKAVTLNWTVENTGAGRATTGWVTAVLLSQDATVSSDDLVLGTFSRYDVLAAAANYAESQAVVVPGGLTGNRYLILQLDYYGNQPEANENDNVRTQAVSLSAPDLVITNPAVTSNNANPAVFANGNTLTAQWTVNNNGSAPADRGWIERAILTADAYIGNYDDILIGQVTQSELLAAGASLNRSVNVQIPWGVTGQYKVVIRVDYWNYQPESNETNNSFETQINIVYATPPADLMVETVVAPATAPTGSDVAVSWRVTNRGTAATTATRWYDYVYLSADDTFGGDTFLGSFERSGALNSEANYGQLANVRLPEDLTAGNYWIFVVTDATN